ncbi:hypothetical protein [uncultured Micrococcus sp.]|uniref:hypothetical protein n=1 Tax=uncultured Micrococcus sp. TaxID=114051 RepID=UPI002596DA09|nr:hypothetical protein [uncultured Micrococcus sp.]
MFAADPARAPRRAASARLPRVAAVGAALALALSACSGGEEQNPAGGQEGSATAQDVEASGQVGQDGAASDEQAADVARGLELGDRPDQKMAQAAAERAATFGFVRQQAASEQEVQRSRDDNRARLQNPGRTTVEPSDCKAPLTALDFSPIMLDTRETTRIDVGADSFTGTGTIEVAALDGPGRQRVEKHLQTVNTLAQDCETMTMTVAEDGTETRFELRAEKADLSDGSPAQSGLVWRRWLPSDEDQKLTVQVLTATTDDHVVMVSFAGQDETGQREFTLMAEEILAAARRAD